jgi:hypothetical protein
MRLHAFSGHCLRFRLDYQPLAPSNGETGFDIANRSAKLVLLFFIGGNNVGGVP